MTQTLLLVDGHWLFHRAYHAGKEQGRWTAEGLPTWAAYGFTRSLLTAIGERKPDAVAVAFDVGRATHRRMAYPAYKANRTGMPADQASQLPIIREIVAALGLASYEAEGYEADDVIGTITLAATGRCYVEIMTADRDLFQLVRPGVKVLMPKKLRSIGEPGLDVYDETAVLARMGVSPDRIVDLKALMGDASDNIPGVPGVGQKTALTLLEHFGSFDAIFADERQLFKRGLRARLSTHEATARMSYDLAKIDCRVPINFNLDDCRLKQPDASALVALLERLEFHDLAEGFGMIQGSVA